MPKLTDQSIIIDGSVMGFVETDMQGSRTEFEICSVEEWLKLTPEQAEKVAKEALAESGVFEWGY